MRQKSLYIIVVKGIIRMKMLFAPFTIMVKRYHTNENIALFLFYSHKF